MAASFLGVQEVPALGNRRLQPHQRLPRPTKLPSSKPLSLHRFLAFSMVYTGWGLEETPKRVLKSCSYHRSRIQPPPGAALRPPAVSIDQKTRVILAITAASWHPPLRVLLCSAMPAWGCFADARVSLIMANPAPHQAVPGRQQRQTQTTSHAQYHPADAASINRKKKRKKNNQCKSCPRQNFPGNRELLRSCRMLRGSSSPGQGSR